MARPTKQQREYALSRAHTIINKNNPIPESFDIVEAFSFLDLDLIHWSREAFCIDLLRVFPEDYANIIEAKKAVDKERKIIKKTQDALYLKAKDKIMLADSEQLLDILADLQK